MAGSDEAKQLVDEINAHARAHDNKSLSKLAADPSTREILSLLPERESRQASVHLDAAQVWRTRQNEKLGGKLDAADKALKELDLQLARGILRKIDWEILDTEKLDRFNQLFLALEARAHELEQFEVPESPPRRERSKKFWRR